MEYIQGEKFINLNDNVSIFYIKTEDVNHFFYNPPKNPFILISHNSDGKILNYDTKFGANINNMPNNLIKWYGQNVCVIHDKIESIPIGLENSMWFKEINKPLKIYNKNKEDKNFKNLLYINHNIQTNYSERYKPYEMFKKSEFVTLVNGMNGLNFDDYIDNIFNHKFVLCPEGNGTDTHRTWETLYLRSIPIEKRNINNQFYSDLPICFIDSWDEITEEFLNNEYERITKNIFNLQKLDFNYWKSKIIKSSLK